MVNVPGDGKLLGCFARSGDEAPFQELLQRHGRMVFQACYRVLGNGADAEDAAQAVFLTLAQKAKDSALHRCVSLSGWLHKLSWHVAMRLRAAANARRRREQEATAVGTSDSADSAGGTVHWEKLRPLLDEVIADLPNTYRLPFVLCHLEGHSQDEAASLLAMPRRTVSSRLQRAREMLRKQLERRGITLSVGIVAGIAGSQLCAAEPSAAFFTATAKAAALVATGSLAAGSAMVSGQTTALMQQALTMLLWAKLKAIALLVLVAGLSAAMGMASYLALAHPRALPGVPAPPPARPGDDLKPAPVALTIIPRKALAAQVFEKLSHQGIDVVKLGLNGMQSWHGTMQVPVALRFKPIAVRAFVDEVAAANNFKVAWVRDGRAAVLYTGAAEEDIEQCRKDLDSADAAARRDAVWRLGFLQDVRAVPLLARTARSDPDAEAVRLAHVGLHRLNWSAVVLLDDAAAELLAAQLESPDTSLRHDAAYGLKYVRADLLLPLCEKALASESGAVRLYAASALERLRGEHALALAEIALADTEPLVRAAAAQSLASIGGERAFALLEKALTDSNAQVRVDAVEGLGRLGRDRAMPILEALYADADPSVRRSAAYALRFDADAGHGAIPARLQRALSSTDPSVRGGAILALSELDEGQALAVLEKGISDPDPETACLSVAALGALGGERPLVLLETALASPHIAVRGNAAAALGNIGGDKATALLGQVLKDPHASVPAVAALSRAGGAQAPALLKNALANPDTNVQSEASIALARLGGEHALTHLDRILAPNYVSRSSSELDVFERMDEQGRAFIDTALKSHDAWVRMRALSILHTLNGRSVLPQAEAALADPDRNMRLFALSILANLDGEKALALIETALLRKDCEERYAAARYLGCFGGENALSRLEKALASADPSMRQVALFGLSFAGGDRVGTLVEKAMADSDPDVRVEAVASLGNLDGKRACALIEAALLSPDANLRWGAVRALECASDKRQAHSLNYDRDALNALVERQLADPDASVRILAIHTMTGMDASKTLPWLKKASEDSAWTVRAQAAGALVRLGRASLERRARTPPREFRTLRYSGVPTEESEAQALTCVEKALADNEPVVRVYAIYALRNFDDVPRLLKNAFADPDPIVRQAAADIADSRSMSSLERALADPDARVRRNAARSLGETGTANTFRILFEALKTEKDDVVRSHINAAMQALAAPTIKDIWTPAPKHDPAPQPRKPPMAPKDDAF